MEKLRGQGASLKQTSEHLDAARQADRLLPKQDDGKPANRGQLASNREAWRNAICRVVSPNGTVGGLLLLLLSAVLRHGVEVSLQRRHGGGRQVL